MEMVEVILVAGVTVASLATVLRILIGWWLKIGPWKLPAGRWFGKLASLDPTPLHESVLHELAVVTTLNLPLGQALLTASRSERGRVAIVLRRLGESVAAGQPLSTAFRQATSHCPPLISSAVAAGERSGQLSRVLTDLDATLHDQRHERPPHSVGGGVLVYPLIVVLIALLVLAVVITLIVPKFYEIFLDFDVKLPRITTSLINTVGWLGGDYLLAVVILFPLLLVVLILPFLGWGSPLAEGNGPIFRWLYDVFGWIPGLTRPVSFGHGMSLTLRITRSALSAGMTLPAAAELAATVRVNRYLRRRWEQFAKGLESGVPASTAAQDAGLGSVVARACQNLERFAADPQLALDHAADYHRTIALRWQGMLVRIGWPVLIFLLGCLVGYVVLALFMPLVSLINAVLGM